MEESEHDDTPHVMGRKAYRPLPPKGCSTAFFIFLAALAIGLTIAFICYKRQ